MAAGGNNFYSMKQAIRIAMVGGALVAATSALGQLTGYQVSFQTTPGQATPVRSSGWFGGAYPATVAPLSASTAPITGSGAVVTYISQLGTGTGLGGTPPQITGSITGDGYSQNLLVSVLSVTTVSTPIDIAGGGSIYSTDILATYGLSLPFGTTIPVNLNNLTIKLFSGGNEFAFGNFSTLVTPVPEPEVYTAAAALGLVGFGLWKRRNA